MQRLNRNSQVPLDPHLSELLARGKAALPDTRSVLQHWYRLMKAGQFRSFVELRATFPSADQIGKLTVFNIGGGKARLIAAIHYNRQKVYIRAVLTHDEYNKGRWKE